MGRAAGYKTGAGAGGGGGGERRRRPIDLPFRRPSGANADGAATQRNVIPWQAMEAELAKRLAAKAARGQLDEPLTGPPGPAGGERESGDALAKSAEREVAVEPAPDSGVRSSQDCPPVGVGVGVGVDSPDEAAQAAQSPVRPLTYSMYTISDLDAGGAQPVRLAPEPPPVKPVIRWANLGHSVTGVTRAVAGWARLPKPRPRVLDVCRPALEKFGFEARAAAAVAWSSGLARRLAIGFAIGFGSLLVLAVVVMTVADLTDDVKPTHGTTHTTHAVVPNAPSVSSGLAPADSAAGSVPPVVELGNLDAEPSAKAKTKAAPAIVPSGVKSPTVAPKAKHETKKTAPAERFIP